MRLRQAGHLPLQDGVDNPMDVDGLPQAKASRRITGPIKRVEEHAKELNVGAAVHRALD